MSYTIVNEHGDADQVASNQGWYDFSGWAGKLPLAEYFEVRHLVKHGWERDLPDLKAQLKRAILDSPPLPDIKSTAQGIIAYLNKHESEVVMITNGQAPDGQTEEQ